jgi:Uma2 family endonuclease
MKPARDQHVPSPDAVVFSAGGEGRMPEKGTPSQLPICRERDGSLTDENTKRLRWIAMLFENLATLFRDQASVLVARDLPWEPVQGNPEARVVPGVLVAFGRPSGGRDVYRQWEEENVPPTVVFDILTSSARYMDWLDDRDLAEDHGVEEYYAYYFPANRLLAYLRLGEDLLRVKQVDGFVSPRLGIRFDLSGSEMVIFRPDGRRFLTFEELEAAREQ